MPTIVIAMNASRFPLGSVLITPGARDALDPVDVAQGLSRHARADWGEVCREDARLNDAALKHGDRLLSVYRSSERWFWIITEADRSATTVLLPEEY